MALKRLTEGGKNLARKGYTGGKRIIKSGYESAKSGGIAKTLVRPTVRRITRLAVHAIAVGFQKKPIEIKGKDIPVEGLAALPAIGVMMIPGANAGNRRTVAGDVLEGLANALITRGAVAQSAQTQTTKVHADADGRIRSVESSAS